MFFFQFIDSTQKEPYSRPPKNDFLQMIKNCVYNIEYSFSGMPSLKLANNSK